MHMPLMRKMLIAGKLNGILFCLDLLKWVKEQNLLEKYLKTIAYEVNDSSWADEKVVHTNQALA